MKLTKKQETEIWQVYDTWLQSYLNGDVVTYDSYFDTDYHFIGSTDNEEFLSKKDTTQFFADTAEQLAGKCDLRNETRIIEKIEGLVFITHLFDAWFLNGNNYAYYGRFRFTNALKKNKEGWRFTYQHFSTPDSKTDEGDTIGFNKVSEENLVLKDAIKRRTIELEQKNRQLKIETALERIRAQAVAMKQSSDLLDIVVAMRTEFTKLGHEAHYFWHMMWLPETYEKAMTSGDGSKIGFVMELPRHIHGDIPLLAKWEKSKKPTVVYPMKVEEAIDYVDKMVALGDFKNIDPQAPTRDDIKHIGGLTFIMARTTHGEIGYSLPGLVNEPPKEDIDLLVKFAGAFDLAHQRFLDLQKAEAQARETLIELSLERIRSKVTAMQESSDLFDVVVTMRNEFLSLGHEADYFWHMKWAKDSYEMSMTAEDGGRLGMVITVPKFVHERMDDLFQWEKSNSPYFVLALNGEEAWDYIEKMNTYGQYKLVDPHAPTEEDILHIGGLTFIIARTTHGEIGFSLAGKIDNPPQGSIDILVRFASVFDLAYKRFEDLQNSEKQAKETQIELALEKVRSRTMAMQHSYELAATSLLLFKQFKNLGEISDQISIGIINEENKLMELYSTIQGEQWKDVAKVDLNEPAAMKKILAGWKKKKKSLVIDLNGNELKKYNTYRKKLSNRTYEEKRWVIHVAFFSKGVLTFSSTEPYPSKTIHLLERFATVFDATFRRFLDLKKAEAQAREAQIEAALERVRSRGMAMHKSDELLDVISLVSEQLEQLGFRFVHVSFANNDNNKSYKFWTAAKGLAQPTRFETPYIDIDVFKNIKNAQEKSLSFFSDIITKEEHWRWHKHLLRHGGSNIFSKEQNDVIRSRGMARSIAINTNIIVIIANYASIPYSAEENEIFDRFGKVFEQSYTRFLDLQKAEAQTREAKIEAALERVRSRSMAMHKSDELRETGDILFNEITNLGIESITSGFVILEEDENIGWNYAPNPSTGKIMPVAVGVYHKETPIMLEILKNWKKKVPVFMIELDKKQTIVHQTFIAERSINFPINAQELIAVSPKELKLHNFNFEQGYLLIVGGTKLTEEQITIMRRFTKVFQQTYTRFLDLQKAEAQARASQIEVAVERVRAEAMAMHATTDFEKVTKQLLKQVKHLDLDGFTGASIMLIDNNDYFTCWDFSSPGNIGDTTSYLFRYNAHDYPLLGMEVLNKWKEGKDYMVFEYNLERLNIAVKEWEKTNPVVALEFKKAIKKGDFIHQWNPCGRLSKGLLTFDMVKPPDDDVKNITIKMTHAFEQAYIRFLDLQKAEAQAREAQIETALEKVRSRTMAMQHSQELPEAANVLFTEVQNLGIPAWSCGYNILSEDKTSSTCIMSSEGEIQSPFTLPLIKHKSLKPWHEAILNNEQFFVYEQGDKDLEEHYDYMQSLPDLQDTFQQLKDADITLPTFQVNHLAKFTDGFLLFITYKRVPEAHDIFQRFAKVFEQTYTRFLDLQKVEAQAREAKIEAALEKIRSRSLAMHKPDELQEVVALIAEKLRDLGVIYDAGGVILCTYFPDNKDVMHWIAAEDFSYSGNYLVPYFETTIFKDTWDSKNRGDAYFSKEFSVEDKNSFFEYAFEHSDYKHFPNEFKQHALEAKNHRITAAWSKNSAILIPSFGIDEPSKSDAEILKRFAKVFEQAYIRFMDLQKAEERARETQIDIALERVRSRTMGMQKSDELAETSSVLFQQIKELASETWSCGFCIWQDNDEVELWMGADSGGLLPPMLIPYKKEPTHRDIYEASLRKEPEYNKIWNGKPLKEHYAFLRTIPSVSKAIKVMEDSGLTLPKQQCYYVGFFKHGYLLLITEEPNDDLIDLSQRFTKVFDLTYTRFLDLQLREKQAVEILNEKQRLEKTLTDLKQTQKQLIQSEKMASLGELTAGIAHEIQNPLNFVNNFSEVSKELIEEMQEELDQGDMEEVRAIMLDIIQNLDKINHHGKRADNIVKGMLQHSRASGDKKESTDINKLADEYMRLAYHGLRAKNKQFNATLKTDFDDKLPKIMVIPQDIGRVILNLFTNAFYAVDEKSSSAKASKTKYEPTVSVGTKQVENSIEITVTDNGNGIPSHVLDKIFQPFFTTKPTGQGTGLGLSMSYDIIKKGHGGEFKVETELKQGSTFSITLPHKS